MRNPIDGRTVLVTGASDGIGKAIVERLDGRPERFILVSRRQEVLDVLAASLRTPSRTIACDLATEEGPDQLLAALADTPVDLLVNNAGVTRGGAFSDQDLDALRAMLRLNIEAPMRLIHGLLPGWRARGGGAVLDVSSVAAFVPCPGQCVYAATKAFLHSFGEGLAGEWRIEEGSGLHLTTLAPGSTRTAFFRRGGIDSAKLLKSMQSPEAVARAAVRGLERGKPLVVPGLANRLIDLAVRIVPRAISRAGARRVFRPLVRGEARVDPE